MPNSVPAIVIHAGAGRFLSSRFLEERARTSLQRIVLEAFGRLLAREGALRVVAWAVSELENDPQFNAGTGAKLQRDGVARLSAGLMDGHRHRFSGVVNIEEVKNPILIARRLQKERDRILAGSGAMAYARRERFDKYNPIIESSKKEWKGNLRNPGEAEKSIFGTVGAVAADMRGRLAAATSTGGKGLEIVGRVSDSATIAGNYASNHAAVSATGVGEEIVEIALAARIVTRVDDGALLPRAFSKTFREFRGQKGRGGAIGVDSKGGVMVSTTTECILHALRTPKDFSSYP